MNLFRSLPKPPPATCDPDDEPEPFSDPQWPHLVIVYELLLHLARIVLHSTPIRRCIDWNDVLWLSQVSNDAINVSQKKRMVDTSFVRQLLLLFDSEDFRERDYLKNITHRIYSKLTQRRALIRRVICNIFFEVLLLWRACCSLCYASLRLWSCGSLYLRRIRTMVSVKCWRFLPGTVCSGLLQACRWCDRVVCSIINGFCVPIKDEHKVMLVRALIPLHKVRCALGCVDRGVHFDFLTTAVFSLTPQSANVGSYHPQLSYCMVLYASKDHTLTREVCLVGS
jgi:serine/threonine-protein phosphatase 2A regulatory subunit B'